MENLIENKVEPKPLDLGNMSLTDIMAECYNSSKFMAQLLFPDEFYAPMNYLHDQLFDFIDHCDAPRKAIAAPRGIGKTTIVKLLLKRRILFRDRHFIGYLTNSSDVAQMFTSSIQMDLTSNLKVKKIFGDVKTSKVEGVDEKWSTTSWIANGETMVLPRGASQQVNGLLWGHYRPDLWLVDDLDDRVEVRNSVQRKKLREWFYGVLMYTFAQYEDYQDYEIIYTDTVKHPDALIVHLMEDPDWEHLALSVCDQNYKTLAPNFRSQERLDKEIDGHRERKTMDLFAREMMSIAISLESGNFKPSLFKYYEENDPEFVKEIRPRLANILIWDPAKTVNATSDQTGLVIWGLDLEYNAFYVRFASGEYLTVNDQHSRVIQLAEQYRIQALGLEVTSLEDHIVYPFKNECLRRNKPWLIANIVELKARTGKGEFVGAEGGKEGRIAYLLPYYEQGLVWHNKNAAGPLEQQLLGSKLRDVADAAAYLPQMLIKGAKYMSPVPLKDYTYDEEAAYRQLDHLDMMKRKVFA